MKFERLIEVAIKEARKCSDYRIQVGCVIFNKNKILSVGHNCKRYHKKLHPTFYSYRGEIHAEMNAIVSAKRNLKGSSILVVRINRFNQFRLSKPCNDCMKYILFTEIRKIYYTDSSYPYIKELKI